MLHRFRQTQVEDLGLNVRRHDRRPKVISTVNSVRDCDRWRDEVMREISRKVARIQDGVYKKCSSKTEGLTDYELRDLNDEINHLFREKGQWERQIAALGGANYRSGVPRILDDHGEEIPGMRGYRYYGRARDLPGVKEHLRPAEAQEDQAEESRKEQRIKAYQGQPPAYFGNEDEQDGVLLQEEVNTEDLGWSEGWRRVAATMDMSSDVEVPAMPRPPPVPLDLSAAAHSKNAQDTPANGASLLNALPAEELVMPDTVTRKDMEAFMLQAKKAALRQECT